MMTTTNQTQADMQTYDDQGCPPLAYRRDADQDDSYQQQTYDIVSKVAYLSGVHQSAFQSPNTSIDYEIFQTMSDNRDARIVRSLSMLRTVINRHFRAIDQAMTYDMKNLNTLERTQEIVKTLSQDGVDIVKANQHASYYIAAINQHMPQYIDRCKCFFPEWIEFSYIRSLFVFPNLDKKVKQYFAQYMKNIDRFPYQVCINWTFKTNHDFGNLFQNDQKFLSQLYLQFNDTFTHYNSVHLESQATRSTLDAFAARAEKIVLIVDCENSDPIKVCAALQSLSEEMQRSLVKAILYNDANTSSCWDLLSQFTNVSVEHQMTERVLGHKSLVDATLVAGACCEHYENKVDSFLLASSDSDFIGLVRSLPKARFLWLVENSKVSSATLHELERVNVPYCSLDEFNDGDTAYKLKNTALLSQCKAFLAQHFTSFNLEDMLQFAFQSTCIEMPETEKLRFKKKYLQGLHVEIDEKGNLSLVLGR